MSLFSLYVKAQYLIVENPTRMIKKYKIFFFKWHNSELRPLRDLLSLTLTSPPATTLMEIFQELTTSESSIHSRVRLFLISLALPDRNTVPEVHFWYLIIAAFAPNIRAQWAAPKQTEQKGQKKGGQQ